VSEAGCNPYDRDRGSLAFRGVQVMHGYEDGLTIATYERAARDRTGSFCSMSQPTRNSADANASRRRALRLKLAATRTCVRKRTDISVKEQGVDKPAKEESRSAFVYQEALRGLLQQESAIHSLQARRRH
jgi:hypothetical protein